MQYTRRDGGAPATAPGAQTFWTEQDSGTGTRTIVWDAAPGHWTVVIMNADGSAGVDADVSIGAELPVLRLVAAGFVAGGIALGVAGFVLLALSLIRPRRSV